MATNTNDFISSVLRLIGVIAATDTPQAEESNNALAVFNQMTANWANSNFLSVSTPTISKVLTSGQSAYTIGSGGDIDTIRLTGIQSARYNNGGIDYNLQVIAYKDYQEIEVKDVTSIPRVIAVNPAYPLSTIYLYPAPTGGTLYIDKIAPITDLQLDEVMPYPADWIRALRYNLAIDLAPEFGIEPSAAIVAIAQSSLAAVMRSNIQVPKAKFDPLLVTNRNYGILTGGY